MIIDKALQLSDGQAVTSSAASTNFVDLKAGGDAYDELFYVATVTEDFTGSGTLTIAIQTDDVDTFANAETLATSSALTADSLKAGAEVKFRIPYGLKRYVRAYYTASSAFSAGKISLNVARDVKLNG